MTAKGFLEQPQLHAKAPFRSAMLTYPGNLKEALRQAQADSKKTLFGVAHGIPSVFVTKVDCTSVEFHGQILITPAPVDRVHTA